MIFLIRWLYRRHRAHGTSRNPHGPPVRAGARNVMSRAPRGSLRPARFSRNKQARFFTLLLPLVFLVILVGMFGNHTVGPAHIKESTYFVPGLAALAVISSSFVNLVMSITAQRESGVLKRRRVTPVPASVLIAGRALSTMTVSLGVLAAVLVVGRFAYDVRLPVGAIPAVALIAIVGSITFCVLGYALSSLIGSADAAQPIVQAIVLPLYFISGVFVPAVELPAWLRRVAEVFPVERLADSLHQAFDVAPRATSVAWSDLGVLALWIGAGLAVVLWRFKWTPAGRSA